MPEFACLTICNPYPWLILKYRDQLIPQWVRENFGPAGKRCENRTWPTSFGGEILIHAGKSKNWLKGIPPVEFERLGMLFGYIVGKATLYDCVRIDRNRHGGKVIPRSSRYRDVSYPELVTDEHAHGEFCWLLKDVCRIDEPIEYKGQQGIWRVPFSVMAGRTFTPVESGSAMTSVKIDAALGSSEWDLIGAEIVKAKGDGEDASGSRRYVAERLKLCDYKAVMKYLPHLTLDGAKALRAACAGIIQ